MVASDFVKGRERSLGAPPWGDQAKIDRQNAQRFAANFKTPTLVLHGEKDFRVPLTQGLEYYNTLRQKGVPARLVYFPDENHWMTRIVVTPCCGTARCSRGCTSTSAPARARSDDDASHPVRRGGPGRRPRTAAGAAAGRVGVLLLRGAGGRRPAAGAEGVPDLRPRGEGRGVH